MTLMRAIVVGYDGSDAACRALERVAELAGNSTAVTVVSTAPVTYTSLGPLPPDEDVVAEHRREIEEARRLLAGKGLDVRGVDNWGDPADVIVRVAQEEEADLVVGGTHGKNVAERLVLGSVSDKVVHHAPCDVLVVR